MKNSFTFEFWGFFGKQKATAQFLYGVCDPAVGTSQTMVTLCRVMYGGSEFRGFALLNPEDADNVVKGQKVALESTIHGHMTDFRKAAWKAYLEWANIQKKEVMENA